MSSANVSRDHLMAGHSMALVAAIRSCSSLRASALASAMCLEMRACLRPLSRKFSVACFILFHSPSRELLCFFWTGCPLGGLKNKNKRNGVSSQDTGIQINAMVLHYVRVPRPRWTENCIIRSITLMPACAGTCLDITEQLNTALINLFHQLLPF